MRTFRRAANAACKTGGMGERIGGGACFIAIEATADMKEVSITPDDSAILKYPRYAGIAMVIHLIDHN